MAPSSRMLTLLSLLQARRDWPAHVLAQRLSISDRTVRRDVDRLRELGYRIRAIKGPDGGYRLDAGSELPPLLFDDDQAVVLAVALQSVGVSGTAFEEPASRALATVRQVMPARLRHRIDALRVTAVPGSHTAGDHPVATDVLLALGAAVRAREVLRFEYVTDRSDPAGEPRPLRRVEPHHVVTRSGRWYLVAWDLDREDWRTYRADRIIPRTHTGPTFEPRQVPGRDVRAFVAARFKGSDGADVWPCNGEVILHLPARDVSPYVGDGVVEELPNGRCRLFLGAWSWPGLAATIGRFDADVEVVGPPELAEAFATLGRRFAAAAASAPGGTVASSGGSPG
ncbi:YafY family transcriptional regulator [Plantibacter flavus]|uniref:helix-turn-helix transcriptional regulator n=1 Tax=Plantibacter flavus TaxID=150123 RepID=UPI003F179E4B